MLQIRNIILRPRPLNIAAQCYCTNLPQDPKKENKMPTNLTDLTEIKTKEMAKMQLPTKGDMQWRTPWHEKEGQYYSVLRTFYSEDNNTNVIKFLQQPVDISPSAIKKWWNNRKERKEIMMQSYIPERNEMLGNELAAAHFIVYRGGSVKFFGEEQWIKANDFREYSLPKRYQDNMFLQAIDCTDMNLYYEGLVNLRGLRQVEWLSLNGCENLDDWSIDRASYLFADSLLYLDLRNMPLITFRGLGALYKMEKLKILYVDDDPGNREFEMTCLMLQEIMPNLDVRFE